jgi:non-ribosomal peptide synthetase-like protein
LFLVAGFALVPSYYFLSAIHAWLGLLGVCVALPLAYLLWGFSLCTFTLLFKTLTRYRTQQGSFSYNSLQVARWAITTRLVEFCNTLIMGHLRSTPYINLWFRLLGAKIGKDVFINTCELTDWDLLTIGDHTMLGAGVVIQAHAAEAGKLHFRPVTLGKHCTVGRSSVVLPGVEMADHSILGAVSIASKDTKIPSNSIWGGVPASLIKYKDEKKKTDAPQA